MGQLSIIGCNTNHPVDGVRRYTDIGRDEHTDHCLIYMPIEMGESGRSWHYQGGKQAEGRARTMTFVEGNREYRVHRPPYVGLTLVVPIAMLREHLPNFEQLCIMPHDARTGALSIVWDLIMSVWTNHMTLTEKDKYYYADVIIKSLADALKPLQNMSSREDISKQTYLRKALEYVDIHISNPLLSPEMIADSMEISKRYLYEIFHGYEQTLGTVIREKRLEKCHAMLGRLDMKQLSVTEVAYRWGFSSYTHFSRVFKEKYSVSPRKYRQDAVKRPNLL